MDRKRYVALHKRNKKAVDMHASGATFDDVAVALGLSAERIRQIVRRTERPGWQKHQQRMRHTILGGLLHGELSGRAFDSLVRSGLHGDALAIDVAEHMDRLRTDAKALAYRRSIKGLGKRTLAEIERWVETALRVSGTTVRESDVRQKMDEVRDGRLGVRPLGWWIEDQLTGTGTVSERAFRLLRGLNHVFDEYELHGDWTRLQRELFALCAPGEGGPPQQFGQVHPSERSKADQQIVLDDGQSHAYD